MGNVLARCHLELFSELHSDSLSGSRSQKQTPCGLCKIPVVSVSLCDFTSVFQIGLWCLIMSRDVPVSRDT